MSQPSPVGLGVATLDDLGERWLRLLDMIVSVAETVC